MNTPTPVPEMASKLPWHTPNVYILRGAGTDKPHTYDSEVPKQPSAKEHNDAGDPQGYPHGPEITAGPS